MTGMSNMAKKIVIAGSGGFVGKNIYKGLKERYEVFGLSINKTETVDRVVDATKPEIFLVLDSINPDVVIHVIKLPASVDYYESNREEARSVDVTSIENLADWCRTNNKKLIFLSSDYVYEGTSNNYDEESETRPVNFYGQLKLESEKIVKRVENHTILRPTVIFGANDDKNFLGQMIKSNGNMRVPLDQISNPTDIKVLVDYIIGVIEKDIKGVYVATGLESINRYEFGKKIARVFGLTGNLQAVKTSEMGQLARRPLNCGTNSTRLREILNYNAPSLEESLKRIKEEETERIKKEIMQKVEEFYKLRFANSIFEPGKTTVHNSGKMFDSRELVNGVEAVLDGWWTEGRFSQEFARKLSEYTGINYFILTNSGSSANLLALACLASQELEERRLKKGDEVITIASAFPTTIAPIVQIGCVPVFVDIENIESGQYNIDVEMLEKARSDKTKAIIIAHTLGNPFNLDKIVEFTRKYNLWLVEDCCDALGSRYRNKHVGSFGDVASFSFYPAHHITTGEGGAVATSNPVLKKIINSLRNWGRDCWCDTGKDNTCGRRFSMQFGELPFGYDHKNVYTRLGYNLKSTDLQASIGLAQFEKLEEFVKKRKENFEFLHKRLEKYSNKIILPESLQEASPSWFGFLISVRENAGFTRQQLIDFLQSRKVELRALFAGNITKHPCLKNVDYRIVGSLENTDSTMNNSFWIGVQPNITEEKREYLVSVFDEFFRSH